MDLRSVVPRNVCRVLRTLAAVLYCGAAGSRRVCRRLCWHLLLSHWWPHEFGHVWSICGLTRMNTVCVLRELVRMNTVCVSSGLVHMIAVSV